MAMDERTAALSQLLDSGRFAALRAALEEMHEVDIAAFIEDLPDKYALIVFRTLGKDTALHVFSQLDSDMQQHIVSSITDKELGVIIDDLWVDDTVDMLEEMPATLVKKVLRSSSPEMRDLINQFLKYGKNSAGSIMTAEFAELRAGMTVGDALRHLRSISHEVETIYTCFVTDNTRILLGVVPMKALLLAADSRTVGELMEQDVISVTTTTDREETVKLVAKYGFMSLPVVDAEHRLVGIVTVDDAADVLQEEDTEDFEKMAAISPSEKPYLKTGVFELAKNRFPWLLFLMVSNMLTGVILGVFESVYTIMPVFVVFMPMLTGTGGNAGSQSSTMVIRGMALGEIAPKDFFAVLWKETRVCLLVGAALAVINFARILITNPGEIGLAILVSLVLIGSIFIGKSIGGILPIIAEACRVDPALVAAPLITTIVDALVLVLYFGVAKIAFGL